MSPNPPWPPGTGTGVGSLPGSDPVASARLVLERCPQLPFLPELPARGAPGDLIGRTTAVLADLAVDLQPSGWRLVDRPGRDLHRARDLLARDIDAFAAAAEGWQGPVKLAVAGPWTLAAALEMVRRGKALTDPGAVRDLSQSLAAGLQTHLTALATAVPGATFVVQLDEPGLPAVRDGRLPTASGFGRLRVPDEPELITALATVLAPVADPGAAAAPARGVHCCAADAPVDLLRAAGAQWLSLDLRVLTARQYDPLGEALEAGVALLAGLVRTDRFAAETNLQETGRPLRQLFDRLGFPAGRLAAVAVSPTCGLAGGSPDLAAAALRRAHDLARSFAEDQ